MPNGGTERRCVGEGRAHAADGRGDVARRACGEQRAESVRMRAEVVGPRGPVAQGGERHAGERVVGEDLESFGASVPHHPGPLIVTVVRG